MIMKTTATRMMVAAAHAKDRLWPSFNAFQTEFLAKYENKPLPEGLRNALSAMEQENNDDRPSNNNNKFGFNDEANIHQIGVMAHIMNTALATQMSQPTSEAVYTPEVLEFYDGWVWDFNSPFHWRIHRQDVEQLYQEGLAGSKRHCEVAVGTGLMLRQWAAKSDTSNQDAKQLEHVTLMDLSPFSLEDCFQRLQKEDYFASNVAIDKVKADIYKLPPENLQGTFDSVGANFLFHCLHGDDLHDKRAAIESCSALLQKKGVFFGSTILGADLEADAATAGPHAISTNQLYNKLGIFGNQGDKYDDMVSILEDLFHDVTVVKIGYCAAWLARNPKHATTASS